MNNLKSNLIQMSGKITNAMLKTFNFINKETLLTKAQFFPVNFVKFLRPCEF